MIYQRLAKVFLICSEANPPCLQLPPISRGPISEEEQMRNEIVRKAIELGRPHGFVTFDQLDELLRVETQAETMAPEDIEALLGALSDEGINVVEAC
jgi:Sigma-70 factor, region 1.1